MNMTYEFCKRLRVQWGARSTSGTLEGPGPPGWMRACTVQKNFVLGSNAIGLTHLLFSYINHN